MRLQCSMRRLATLVAVGIVSVVVLGVYSTWSNSSHRRYQHNRELIQQLVKLEDDDSLTSQQIGGQSIGYSDHRKSDAGGLHLRQKPNNDDKRRHKSQVEGVMSVSRSEIESEQLLEVTNNTTRYRSVNTNQLHSTYIEALNRRKIRANRTMSVFDSLLHQPKSKLRTETNQLPVITKGRTVSGRVNSDSSSHQHQQWRHQLGELRGGPGYCQVYNTRVDLPRDAEFDPGECVQLVTSPTVTVCPYTDSTDRHLSQPLRTHRVWEPHIVRHFQDALRQFPAAGVYDIGANIGQYTLLAAAMGRRVVSVEPYSQNVYRLHKAIRLGQLSNKITLVKNAVSDVRDTFELDVANGNPAGVKLTSQDADKFCDEPECPPHATTIFLDDLLEVTNFETAIMKIDVEGFEHRAFVHADNILAEISIPYIFMEWTRMREFFGSEVDNSTDKRLVQRLVDCLTERHYKVYGIADEKQLNTQYWFGWPNDIVWISQSVTKLHPLSGA